MQHKLQDLIDDWNVLTKDPVSLKIGIHTDVAKGCEGEHEDRLDYESVRQVLEAATAISELGSQEKHDLIVSDTTAKNLHNTFPLKSIEQESIDFAIFGLTMPRPVRR